MGQYIVHHQGWFFGWSTVSDGPETCALTRREMELHVRDTEGYRGLTNLVERLDAAEKRGTSSRMSEDARAAVSSNSMGEDGGEATLEQIVATLVAERDGRPHAPDPEAVAAAAREMISACDGVLADRSSFGPVERAIHAQAAYEALANPDTVLWLANEVLRLRDR